MQRFPFLISGFVLTGCIALNYMLMETPVTTSPILPAIPEKTPFHDKIEVTAAHPQISPASVQTYARPLFSPNRRKYEKPEKVVAVAMPAEKIVPAMAYHPIIEDLPELVLLGSQQTPNGRSALILTASDKETRWIAEGEKIEKWTLSSISQFEIEFVQADRKTVVSLFPTSKQNEK